SSDVCSSDLRDRKPLQPGRAATTRFDLCTAPFRASQRSQAPLRQQESIMLMHRFNPTDHFRTMDMLFDAIMPPAGRRATHFARKPGKISLEDGEQAFTLRAELPGLDPAALEPAALELSVGEDWIELTAKRTVEVPEGYEAIRRERGSFEFSRRITLPKRVDGDNVEAELVDGVLTVTLPKYATAQA